MNVNTDAYANTGSGGDYYDAASDDPYENYRTYCLKFAELLVALKEYYVSAGEEPPVPIPTDDRVELDAKFVMAQSVLDNFSQGFTGGDVVPWLSWATNMLELLGDIEAAYYSDLSLNDGTDPEALAFDQVS